MNKSHLSLLALVLSFAIAIPLPACRRITASEAVPPPPPGYASDGVPPSPSGYVSVPASISTGETNSPILTTAQVDLKMKQIELQVAFKQFEKLENALSDARMELELDQLSSGTDAQKAVHSKTLADKYELLNHLKARLRDEIQQKRAEIEELGKEADSAGSASRH